MKVEERMSMERFMEATVGMVSAGGYGEYFFCPVCGYRIQKPPYGLMIAVTCPVCDVTYIDRRGG